MFNDSSVGLESTIFRSPDQLTGDIDHEVVLLSLDRGEYYQLNGVGSRVWTLLESPTTVSALVERLLEEFDVGREACELQVLEFVRALYAERLIQVENGRPLDG